LNQTTHDNRISQRTIATVDLTLLADAMRSNDESTRDEAREVFNGVYTAHALAEALSERLKAQTIADLESKHVDALMLKAELDRELGKLNRQSWDLQNESGRIAGRLQQAQHRLTDHLELRKHWQPALLLPAKKIEWEVKKDELQQAVESARNLQTDMQLEAQALNNDLESLAHRISTVTGEAITLYARIQRLKGSKEPIMDSGTGLAS
jgi:chromosome segregation ATPase